MRKPNDEPMRLEDIEKMLVEAAKVSNNRQFVVAGSLSCVASAMNLPKRMMMSRDIDIYTKEDPERVFIEIAETLAEGSAFHIENGFYADPISPKILSLPEGWETRLTPITLSGGVVAWFVNANDAACAKLIRGLDHDIEWLRAGLVDRILNPDFISQRLSSCENVLDDEVGRARSRFYEIMKDVQAVQLAKRHLKP